MKSVLKISRTVGRNGKDSTKLLKSTWWRPVTKSGNALKLHWPNTFKSEDTDKAKLEDIIRIFDDYFKPKQKRSNKQL